MLEGVIPSNIPIPDPSVRTTEQIQRELGAQREFLEAKIEALKVLATDRVTSLKELIDQQIEASSAAIAKSETSVSKDIEALEKGIFNAKEGFASEIRNLSSRMDRMDGARNGAQITIGNILGIVGGGAAVLAIVVSIWTHTGSPTVGADTKRVDDLIAQSLERNRDLNTRLDALSARLNMLSPSALPATSK